MLPVPFACAVGMKRHGESASAGGECDPEAERPSRVRRRAWPAVHLRRQGRRFFKLKKYVLKKETAADIIIKVSAAMDRGRESPFCRCAAGACSHKPKRTSLRQMLSSAALKLFVLHPANSCSEIPTFGLCEQTLRREKERGGCGGRERFIPPGRRCFPARRIR